MGNHISWISRVYINYKFKYSAKYKFSIYWYVDFGKTTKSYTNEKFICPQSMKNKSINWSTTFLLTVKTKHSDSLL